MLYEVLLTNLCLGNSIFLLKNCYFVSQASRVRKIVKGIQSTEKEESLHQESTGKKPWGKSSWQKPED